MSKSGSCLCGAITYTLSEDPTEFNACHCDMCRKWSGGIFLGHQAAADTVTVNGAENLTIYTSSTWAQRAFCKSCGSNVYYRVTAPGPHEGNYHFGVGTLDDLGDVPMTSEYFIDNKPSGYSFAGNTKQMTTQEVMELFASV